MKKKRDEFMNKQEMDIMNILIQEPFINQRILADGSGYSLGKVNQVLKSLQNQGFLNEKLWVTDLAKEAFEKFRPQNAVILAAGYGMRMVPINTEIPKGLIQVNGELLIERLIRQLHEKGITDITVVVGFMKESYEYLIDKYEVKLLVNMEYAFKNNLHSVALAAGKIGNTYVIPCDIWCGKNPFGLYEPYSWYMVSDLIDDESNVRVNRKQELVRANHGGNQMIGLSYITGEDAVTLAENLKRMDADRFYSGSFWEEALFYKERMYTAAKVVSSGSTFEINTYEQLREIDSSSEQLKTEALDVIAEIFQTGQEEIRDITVLKKGMTNRSFLFSCKGKPYIMRIPGEGTDQLINRAQEYAVYQAIKKYNICDDIFYINPDNGYKITAYLEDARVCDPENIKDVRRCMEKLRDFHKLHLEVSHSFDLFGQLEFYETLWKGAPSCYRDYCETKKKMYELKGFIDGQPKEWTLTHIDAVPDNFLFVSGEGGEDIRLIDWEYAGMQDAHVDIAMFAIYSLYNREQVEQLINAYFPEGCTQAVRMKIYCYIAVCGLLWSNWCEYKRQLGIEFGEYSLRQYRYAKEYYKIFKSCQEEM